jgi:hypothetical protein
MRIEDRVDPEAMDLALLLEHQVVLAILMAGYAICQVNTKATLVASGEEFKDPANYIYHDLLHHDLLRCEIILTVGDENTGIYEVYFIMSIKFHVITNNYKYEIAYQAICEGTFSPERITTANRTFENIRTDAKYGEVLVNETTIWLKEQLLNLLASRN